jgi:DNA-directed RNA polymerase specialized sigma24 family protein
MTQTDVYDHLPDLDQLAERLAVAAAPTEKAQAWEGEHATLGRVSAITCARDALDQALRTAVAIARHDGHTWSQIATMLGVTTQAAQQRYGR